MDVVYFQPGPQLPQGPSPSFGPCLDPQRSSSRGHPVTVTTAVGEGAPPFSPLCHPGPCEYVNVPVLLQLDRREQADAKVSRVGGSEMHAEERQDASSLFKSQKAVGAGAEDSQKEETQEDCYGVRICQKLGQKRSILRKMDCGHCLLPKGPISYCLWSCRLREALWRRLRIPGWCTCLKST